MQDGDGELAGVGEDCARARVSVRGDQGLARPFSAAARAGAGERVVG